MPRPAILATFVTLAALGALPASARSVYLNEVKVDDVQGLKNLKLEKVTVLFDEKGDLRIDAPGYKIDLVDPSGAPATRPEAEAPGEPKLTRRYFLVTEQTVAGKTGFDIDLYVNSKWIRKLRNKEEQIYSEITRHLRPGKNTVLLSARRGAGAPSGGSDKHVFRVIIGEGNVGGDHVMIDRPLVDFRRTAADAEDVSQEFTFTTR